MTVVQDNTDLTPFDSVTQSLTFADESQNAWWHKTGTMLARVLTSAKSYSREEQLKYLRFHGQLLVPRLGPYPRSFSSSITRSGLPLEFSINYQQHGRRPVVRIGFEPLSVLSGTDKDPFNRGPAAELIEAMSAMQMPEFDTQLWYPAVKDHTLNDAEQALVEQSNVEGGYIKSQIAFGFDLIGDGNLSIKGYTFPALKCKETGKPMAQLMADTVENMKHLVDCSKAFSMVHAYMATTYDDRSFFSWDFASPTKSRLKIYAGSNSVTLEKMVEVWTLGGRMTGPTVTKGLEYLNQLFNLISLEEGERAVEVAFDDSTTSSKATPLVWNYEMRGNDPNPLTKIYFPVHGENDMQVITGVARFFTAIGMKELGDSYVDTVKGYL
ncbi:hypothetical protein FQN49_003199 [Arthroderma sp. PD_2]|nr:hypothetical protein FQN49_003199 [Arthroderma sp. PD_2]